MDETAASDEEAGGEIFTYNDVLSNDQEDPATKAARKMDWDTFMAGLSERDQAVIRFMIEGNNGSFMARKLKVCTSTIQHSKRHLAVKIQEFMGADILIEVRRSPRWKYDLAATKEKLACREERKH